MDIFIITFNVVLYNYMCDTLFIDSLFRCRKNATQFQGT